MQKECYKFLSVIQVFFYTIYSLLLSKRYLLLLRFVHFVFVLVLVSNLRLMRWKSLLDKFFLFLRFYFIGIILILIIGLVLLLNNNLSFFRSSSFPHRYNRSGILWWFIITRSRSFYIFWFRRLFFNFILFFNSRMLSSFLYYLGMYWLSFLLYQFRDRFFCIFISIPFWFLFFYVLLFLFLCFSDWLYRHFDIHANIILNIIPLNWSLITL